jgi:hypothetical protein
MNELPPLSDSVLPLTAEELRVIHSALPPSQSSVQLAIRTSIRFRSKTLGEGIASLSAHFVFLFSQTQSKLKFLSRIHLSRVTALAHRETDFVYLGISEDNGPDTKLILKSQDSDRFAEWVYRNCLLDFQANHGIPWTPQTNAPHLIPPIWTPSQFLLQQAIINVSNLPLKISGVRSQGNSNRFCSGLRPPISRT